MKRIASSVLIVGVISLLSACPSGSNEDSKPDIAQLLLLAVLNSAGTGGGSSTAQTVNCQQTAANPVSTIGAPLGATCTTVNLVNNGDGTVTDSANKLMWTRCTMLKSANQPSGSTSCSAVSLGADGYQAAAAQTVCQGLSFAGYSDWDLPDAAQLETLIDESKTTNPYAFAVFPDVPTSTAYYITSTFSSDATYPRFHIYFNNRMKGYNGLVSASAGLVRCARKI